MSRNTVFILLLSGILICACSLSSALPASGTPSVAATLPVGSEGNTPSAPTPSGPIQAEQAALIRDGDINLIVNGWAEVTLTRAAPSGSRYVAVDFSIVNAGRSPLDLFGMHASWSLQDAGGNTYSPDFGANSSLNLISLGLVFPGEKIRSWVVFAVPQAPGQYTFRYSNDRLPSIAPVSVTLKSEPGISDPPAALGGEIPPAADPASGPFKHGSWQIQVAGVSFTQPCQQAHSQLNCSLVPADVYSVQIDLVQKNLTSRSLELQTEGMFWLQDPSGRRFAGGANPAASRGTTVAGGSEARFTLNILVWQQAQLPALALAFRYGHGQTPAGGDYVLIPLPAVPRP